MEKGPFIDGLPIKNGDFPWQTVSHNQMVKSRFSHPFPDFGGRQGELTRSVPSKAFSPGGRDLRGRCWFPI